MFACKKQYYKPRGRAYMHHSTEKWHLEIACFSEKQNYMLMHCHVVKLMRWAQFVRFVLDTLLPGYMFLAVSMCDNVSNFLNL